MPREATPAFFFVLLVIEHEGRILLVQENKPGRRWYLPAGGVEAGETIAEAAIRETAEEAGVAIKPRGLIAIDESWLPAKNTLCLKWRSILTADVDGDPSPKDFEDEHSIRAGWFARAEIEGLELRSPEVLTWVDLARSGAPEMPLKSYF